MSQFGSLATYILLGILGGFIGSKLKIPAGALIGAMVTVILFKITVKVDWEIPKAFTFILQVFLGIMVGALFQSEMLKVMNQIMIPVVISTLVLVGTGIVLTLVFTRLGLLDLGTAYLGTSPGAMSALLVLALDSGTNVTLVTCFHFFRVVFIILTAPIIFKFFSG